MDTRTTTHRLTHDGTNPNCDLCQRFGNPADLAEMVRQMVQEAIAEANLEAADDEHEAMMEDIAQRRERRAARERELAEEERRRLEQRIDDLERQQWGK
jgi:hypothetical protein